MGLLSHIFALLVLELMTLSAQSFLFYTLILSNCNANLRCRQILYKKFQWSQLIKFTHFYCCLFLYPVIFYSFYNKFVNFLLFLKKLFNDLLNYIFLINKKISLQLYQQKYKSGKSLMIEKELIYEAQQQFQHVICGGGLVGIMWALFLRRRTQSIAVFEKRQEISMDESEWGGRSINLTLSYKSLQALSQLGIKQLVLDKAVPMTHLCFHYSNGDVVKKKNIQTCYSIQRNKLLQILLDIAENNDVSIFYEHEFLDAKFDQNQFIFEAEGRKISVKGKHLYGIDGAGSKVREVLLKHNHGFQVQQWCDIRYKQLFLPADSNGNFQLQKNCYHIWPRGSHMMIAMPNSNGSFSIALFLPTQGEITFEQLNQHQRLNHFLDQYYSDIIKLIPNPVQQLMDNPIGLLGSLHVSSWQLGNKCLLMGDSAHTMTPFYWQGLNAGFNDCLLLDKLLDHNGGQFKDGIFRKFAEKELKNCEAMERMSIDRYKELAERQTDPNIIKCQQIEDKLQQMFPHKYKKVQEAVIFSRKPYSDCLQLKKRNQKVVLEVIKGYQNARKISINDRKHLENIIDFHYSSTLK